MTAVVAIVSGGMDSITLAYLYRHRLYPDADLTMVSVDYGQRHSQELHMAELNATRLGAEWVLVDLTSVGALLSGSALTDPTVEVPEGHYADESMRLTVVPNRNAILLNVAVGIAVARKASRVGTGVHAGDHPIYPDCRPEFIQKMNDLALVANEGFLVEDFRIEAPFSTMGKHDIARLGDSLGVDYGLTWSCYKGGEYHCGRCSTCVERREAFHLAGVDDPTTYVDPDFWRSVV